MPSRQEVLNYNKNILKEKKYNKDIQLKLKKRVFDTFNKLLICRGHSGLLKGIKLLDLGSADNTFVDICNQNYLVAKGLDINDNVNFETDSFPVSSNSVDIVTGISIIEHLYSPEKFLTEIKRVLKPNGILILVIPNWKYAWKSYFDDPTHVRPYTDVSIRRLLENFGFDENFIVPWLVKKPLWMWKIPFTFFFARWIIPFRGGSNYIPNFLCGSSSSILTLSVNSKNKKN